MMKQRLEKVKRINLFYDIYLKFLVVVKIFLSTFNQKLVNFIVLIQTVVTISTIKLFKIENTINI